MRFACIVIAVLLSVAAPVHAADDATSPEQMRDEVIHLVADQNWSATTCKRVEGVGKGTVSPTECAAKVDAANAECLDFAKTKVPAVATEQDARFLTQILVTCPVAKVLGIGYIVRGDAIHIQWNELRPN